MGRFILCNFSMFLPLQLSYKGTNIKRQSGQCTFGDNLETKT